MERVLSVSHFHVVFTLPSELRALARCNPERVYTLLFDAARITLSTLAQQRWGAVLGVTAVLHTWTRELHFHPHLHCVVTAGGLNTATGRWVPSHPRYLFAVALMRDLFRGVALRRLRAAYGKGQLVCRGRAEPLAEPDAFERLMRRLFRVKWVVYAKRPFAGPRQVFRYLGRYTHRVAISDRRLLDVSEHNIRIATRNGGFADMSPQQFVARFVLHVLPPGFHKIRHFGLYAPTHASLGLPLAERCLLASAPSTRVDTPQAEPTDDEAGWTSLVTAQVGDGAGVCTRCGGPMLRTVVARSRAPPRRAR